MGRYIIKRISYILLVFLLLSILLFMIYHMLPVDKAAEKAREEVIANKTLKYEERYEYWKAEYGLNGTKLERYLRWLGLYPYQNGSYNGLLQGNLGSSTKYGDSVINVIRAPLANTVTINLIAAALSLGITIPLGIFCAVRRGSRRDAFVQVATIVGYSLPAFIIAIVFIWIFAVRLGWFPVSGMQTAGVVFHSPWQRIRDRLYHLALPLIVMTFCSLGGMTRYVRAAMTEALSLDCIRTARAKGLGERSIVYSYAFRNALIPIVTLVIAWLLGIFSGSLMIENIFSLDGIGRVYFEALQNKDNEIVLALQMFYVLIGLVGNLLIDVVYGLVDPRVRVSS